MLRSTVFACSPATPRATAAYFPTVELIAPAEPCSRPLRSTHVRALHGHGQRHEDDRRPLPGRAGEGAGAGRRRRGAPAPPSQGRRGEESESPPGSAASTSPRPRRSSSSAPRPTPRRRRPGEREARLMRWGLVPRWAKDLKVGYRMINAKAENLTIQPRLQPAGRQVPPPLPDRRRRLLRVDEGRGPQAAAPALALHGRRRRALRLRRPLHPQGVGGRRGPRLRRRLALQLHDRDDDPERGRRPGPRPDAGDPAQPRGRGGLAASRPQRRGRGGDVRAARPGADGERPGEPEAEQSRQRQEEGPELLVAPRASRC